MQQEENEAWKIRLPNEAEWEAISRSKERVAEPKGSLQPSSWPWNDDHLRNEGLLSSRINMRETGIGGPSVVGAFPGGEIEGVQDLLGNVWEWCFDGPREYKEGQHNNPSGEVSAGSDRVLRGGGYWNLARYCRCAYRLAYPPGTRDDDFGFRVVRLARHVGPPAGGG